jgi:hypothetical protein
MSGSGDDGVVRQAVGQLVEEQAVGEVAHPRILWRRGERWEGRVMPAPEVVVFDVNETLFDLAGLDSRFTDVGLDPTLRPLWFARTLRDGFALAAAGDYRPFREVATATMRGLPGPPSWARTQSVACSTGSPSSSRIPTWSRRCVPSAPPRCAS